MMVFFKTNIRKHFLLFIFLFFYFAVISFKLISTPTPFFDWDESINAEVGKEMISQSSLVPLWQGKAWLDKPPLPFLFFGIIMKLTPFIAPEISLRITALILSIIALIFIYLLFLKATKHTFIAFLSVFVTSFVPIFLQRSQVLNLDVFLLIGWIGYLLFFEHFYLSLFFLTIGVLTKSLLGFYPVGIILVYYSFLFFIKKLKAAEFKKIIFKLFTQLVIMSIWYITMLLIFGKVFWQQHIIESHFHRITESIESHFGKKTYYIDLLFEQLRWLTGFSIIGFLVIFWKFINRKLTTDKLLYLLFLLPWFIFLNLTKTKIFWYLYPAIPQFAFLAVFSLVFFNSKRTKIICYLLSFILIFLVLYQNFVKTNFFTTFYSQPEDHYRLALYAKNHCDSLTVLVGKDTREATDTLEKLGLTITSTKQWGDHPSIVYYFGKKVNFIYDKSKLNSSNSNCFVLDKNDLEQDIKSKEMKFLNNFGSLYLFKQK